MTVWFASERTLNVVIIWLQVIDYQKINALNFSQKSVLDRLLHMLIKIFIHFEKIFFWEDFLLRRIFFKEDSLSKRFRFLWKRFQFLSRKFQFLMRRFSFEKIFFQEDLSFLLFAKAKLRATYAGALLSFMNILISFEKIFQICFLPKQNWGHVMPQPLLSSSCLLLRKIAVL